MNENDSIEISMNFSYQNEITYLGLTSELRLIVFLLLILVRPGKIRLVIGIPLASINEFEF